MSCPFNLIYFEIVAGSIRTVEKVSSLGAHHLLVGYFDTEDSTFISCESIPLLFFTIDNRTHYNNEQVVHPRMIAT